MHINRGLLFWGVALITAGTIALAASQGIIDTGILAGAWRLWPLILIGIGLSIALSRTPFAWIGTLAAALVVGIAGGALISVGPTFASCSGDASNSRSSNGSFGPNASVQLDLSCGSLDLAMGEGTGWHVTTRVAGSRQPAVEANSTHLSLRSGERNLPFDTERQDWTVELGQDVTYDLAATLNAADSTLDVAPGRFSSLHITGNAGSTRVVMAGAQITDFDVQLNAGSLLVETNASTDIEGRIDANAGSINLCAPSGVAVSITVQSSIAFSHNLDESGLERSGDTFTSAGFASSPNQVVLEVHGNAASFTLNGEECPQVIDLGS